MLRLLTTSILLLALASSVVAQKGRPRTDIGIRPRPNPCYIVSVPQEPHLDDFNTYHDYVATDSFELSFERIYGQWAQGTVSLQAQASFVGLVDEDTSDYIPPFEGTTPISGGHAFSAGWSVLVTVNGWDGLIVQSPYGNWVQQVPYSESDTAVVRITAMNGTLSYYLDGVFVYSQVAPDIAVRDLRAYYVGYFDDPLVGVAEKHCDDERPNRIRFPQ